MGPRLCLQSQLLLLFFLSVGGPKDQFYFYFPFEEDYNIILPLNVHSTYISKDIYIYIFNSVAKVLSEIRLLTSCLHKSRSCTRNQKTNKSIRHIRKRNRASGVKCWVKSYKSPGVGGVSI